MYACNMDVERSIALISMHSETLVCSTIRGAYCVKMGWRKIEENSGKSVKACNCGA